MKIQIKLPRNLFAQIHEDPAVNPASRRKVVLPRITRQILEATGYAFGDKIRVPGGYAYEVTAPDGQQLKLGLKTAVNRWLNTATTLVEMVDTVIVTTFTWDDDDEKPVALQLIEISSKQLLEMIDKVQREALKRGDDPLGHNYLPLDSELIDGSRWGSVAGAIIPAGRILFGPETVSWIADEWGRVESADVANVPREAVPVAVAGPADVAMIVAKAKMELALQLGIPPGNIDLSIRF